MKGKTDAEKLYPSPSGRQTPPLRAQEEEVIHGSDHSSTACRCAFAGRYLDDRIIIPTTTMMMMMMVMIIIARSPAVMELHSKHITSPPNRGLDGPRSIQRVIKPRQVDLSL